MWVVLLLSVCVAPGIGDVRVVSFPAQDGLTIYADYIDPGYTREPLPMVILLHDLGQTRSVWQSLPASLAESGFAVLAPDLRGHGDSANSRTRELSGASGPHLLKGLQHDLRGAYDWLAQQPRVDRARLVLVGIGLGAAAALEYAVADRSVDVIVGLGPPGNESGVSPGGDLRQLSGRRVHLLGCSRHVPVLEAWREANPNVVVRVLEGEGEVQQIVARAPGLTEELILAIRAGVGAYSREVVHGTLNSTIYHQPGTDWAAAIAPSNLRYYSSAQEAESRGLRAARSRGPGDRPRRTGRTR